MFLQQLLVTIVGVLLSAFLGLAGGQLIISQLALYKFKKLSKGLPIFGEASLLGNHAAILLCRSNCKILETWHKRLGKTMGFLIGDQFCVSTIDLDWIKKFVFDEQETHMNRLAVFPLSELRGSIMNAPKEHWKVARRAVAPALTPNKFKTPNVQREMGESIEKVLASIEKKLGNSDYGRVLNIDDLMARYSINMLAKCFYKQENLVNFDDVDDPWAAQAVAWNKFRKNPLVFLSFLFPFIIPLIDWLHWHLTEVGGGRQALLGFVKAQTSQAVKARRQLQKLQAEAKHNGTQVDTENIKLNDGTWFRRNMIDHLIDQYLDGKITQAQYLDNSCFLMYAAFRTAADSLVHSIYQLSINQDIQQKLRQSVQAEGKESEYLDWLIKESLRLLPTAPIGCSRVIERDMEIDGGHIVPKGTFAITCAYVIHRLREYWGDDADEFKPERWRDTSNHHPIQYIPFGAGLRGCPGKMFAIHEMKELLAALIVRYKFDSKPRKDRFDFCSPMFVFVVPQEDTEVRVTRLS